MKKHSVCLYGHATSFSLEDEFWVELKAIAAERKISIAALLCQLDVHRTKNLSCTVRVFILNELKKKIQ